MRAQISARRGNSSRPMKSRKMSLVVGLMSGTSMDGIDACLVEIKPIAKDERMPTRDEGDIELTLIEFLTKPYPAGVREALFRLSEGEGGGERGGVANVCLYNFLLGRLFAEAAQVIVAQAGHSMDDITVIGSHGQTIQHLPWPQMLHGYSVSATLQIGDPAVIAGECGVMTVGDFRVADMAAGGQGAPLVPYMDRTLLCRRYKKTGRVGVLLNVGGISNVTALLPVSGDLIGFDCGPGNVLIDSLMRRLYGAEFDRDGQTASKGRVIPSLLESLMVDSEDYLHRHPPKSLGREVYGDVYVETVVAQSRELGLSPQDTVATVTAFTAAVVAESYDRYIRPRLDQEIASLQGQQQSSSCMGTASQQLSSLDLFVSGGGAQNTTLMNYLQDRLPAVCVSTTSALGVDPDAKEAMCFALLAYQTVRGVCTNAPSVTGARRNTVLGKICRVPRTQDHMTHPT